MNNVMLNTMVTHQLSGQPGERSCLADLRKRSAAMTATLISTLAAESHSGGWAMRKFTTATGSKATEPSRQTRPKSPQYSRRTWLPWQTADADNWTSQVKLGTNIPTTNTSA